MSSQQLQGLIAQTEQLTIEEQSQLANYLLEKLGQSGRPTSLSVSPEKLSDPTRKLEYKWLAQHRNDYRGKYVALEGERLISYGTDGREVLQQARELGALHPYIVHIDSEDVPAFGGW